MGDNIAITCPENMISRESSKVSLLKCICTFIRKEVPSIEKKNTSPQKIFSKERNYGGPTIFYLEMEHDKLAHLGVTLLKL